MEFEYDPRKSETNAEKQGIDFEEAQELWDSDLLEFTANVKGERRFKAIGLIGAGYWAAVYTVREKRIRIIAVRRATLKERSLYDRYIND